MPLEWRVRFGREVADRDIETEASKISATLLKHPTGFGDTEHIRIGLAWQPDHEIELHFAITVLHSRADALQQVFIRKPLVHDVPQPLGPGLRSEGETGLPCTAEDVSDVLVEAVHPLAG